MLNAEKYKNEILEKSNVLFDFSISKDRHTIEKCLGVCDDCIFCNIGEHCSNVKVRWLLSEYKEPIKLTRLEYDILKYILNHTEYKYIARDRLGEIFIYENKPEKHVDTWRVLTNGGGYTCLTILNGLFKFIKWLDSKPTLIQDILNNCEVVEDDLSRNI